MFFVRIDEPGGPFTSEGIFSLESNGGNLLGVLPRGGYDAAICIPFGPKVVMKP